MDDQMTSVLEPLPPRFVLIARKPEWDVPETYQGEEGLDTIEVSSFLTHILDRDTNHLLCNRPINHKYWIGVENSTTGRFCRLCLRRAHSGGISI